MAAAPGGHRDHAAAFQLGQGTALGEDGAAGRRVVERGEQGAGHRVVGAALDPQGPLPHRGQEPGRAEPLGDVAAPVRAGGAGLGQHHRVEPPLERLVQPGLDVPPDADDVQVGPCKEQLARRRSEPVPTVAPLGRSSSVRKPGRSGRRPGPRAAGRRRGSSPRDPWWAGPSGCAPRPRRPVEQGTLDLLGEQPWPPIAAKGVFRSRSPWVLISTSSTIKPGMEHAEPVGDPLRLPARQRTAPRPDPDLATSRRRVAAAVIEPGATRPSDHLRPSLSPTDHHRPRPWRPPPSSRPGPPRRTSRRWSGCRRPEGQSAPSGLDSDWAGPGTRPA